MVNFFPKSRKSFFKNGNIGRDQILRYVEDVCNLNGISGSRIRGNMTMHELRGIFTSRFFEYRYALSNVPMRTGHRFLKSLKSYKNLYGSLGLPQRFDPFCTASVIGPPKTKAKIAIMNDRTGSNDVTKLSASSMNSGSSDASNSSTGGSYYERVRRCQQYCN